MSSSAPPSKRIEPVHIFGFGQRYCRRKETQWLGVGSPEPNHLGCLDLQSWLVPQITHALAASSAPKGKKYCVPLMGAETFRSNCCRSSLRSTKSISEVFTISRSDDV